MRVPSKNVSLVSPAPEENDFSGTRFSCTCPNVSHVSPLENLEGQFIVIITLGLETLRIIRMINNGISRSPEPQTEPAADVVLLASVKAARAQLEP